jgi:hypothetical protein
MSAEREEWGFARTVCGCSFCAVGCHQRPGCLVPADLDRLCPPGCDAFTWAEEHLRARVGESYPVLVPARRPEGPCHWLYEGRCAVHAQAPYGCAFFDAHMSEAEVERRYAAAAEALRADPSAVGMYTRVWRHLRDRGLTVKPVAGRALAAEGRKIAREALRSLRRAFNL